MMRTISTGGASGRRYRIRNTFSINVDELDEKRKVVRKWCFSPEGSLVTGDVLLAQKLALELFERDALAVANRYLGKPRMLSRVAPIDPRHVLTRCGSFKQGAVRALGRELRRQSVEHGTRPLFLVRVRSKFADVDVVLLDLELQMMERLQGVREPRIVDHSRHSTKTALVFASSNLHIPYVARTGAMLQ